MLGFVNAFRCRTINNADDLIVGVANCFPLAIFKLTLVVFWPFTIAGREFHADIRKTKKAMKIEAKKFARELLAKSAERGWGFPIASEFSRRQSAGCGFPIK